MTAVVGSTLPSSILVMRRVMTAICLHLDVFVSDVSRNTGNDAFHPSFCVRCSVFVGHGIWQGDGYVLVDNCFQFQEPTSLLFGGTDKSYVIFSCFDDIDCSTVCGDLLLEILVMV